VHIGNSSFSPVLGKRFSALANYGTLHLLRFESIPHFNVAKDRQWKDGSESAPLITQRVGNVIAFIALATENALVGGV